MTPEEFGAFGLLSVVTGMAMTLGFGGFASAVVYFQSKQLLTRHRIDSVTWKLVGRGALVAIVAILCGFPFLLASPDLLAIITVSTSYLVIVLVLGVLKTPAEAILLAEKQFGFTALTGISLKLLTVAGMCALYAFGSVGLPIVLLLAAFVAIVNVCLVWFGVWRLKQDSTKIQPKGKTVSLREFSSYSWKTVSSDFLAKLNYRADVFLLAALASPVELGLYTIAVGVAEKSWMVSQSVGEVSFTYMADSVEDQESLISQALVTAKWTAILTLMICGTIALLTPFFGIIFSSNFARAANPVLFLLPGIFTLGVSRIISNAISAMGTPGVNARFGIYGLVLNTAANVALIPQMGASGAAIATSMSYSFMFLLRLRYLTCNGFSLQPLYSLSPIERKHCITYLTTRFRALTSK